MREAAIDSEVSRSGHGVIRKDGKWLASSVDPLREAKQWCETLAAGTGETIIVLGIGCGYHIAELKVRRPQSPVLAIDCDARVAARARDFCPVLEADGLVIEPDWQKLVGNSAVRDALGGPYRVARHAPSLAVEPEYFQAVDRLLRGRDKLSFLFLLKARPEILGLLDADALCDEGIFKDEAVSIKTMQKLFASRPNSTRERRLWRILEELVI